MNESRGNGKPPKYIYVPQRIMVFVRNAPFQAECFLFPYFYSKKLITFCKCVLHFFSYPADKSSKPFTQIYQLIFAYDTKKTLSKIICYNPRTDSL